MERAVQVLDAKIAFSEIKDASYLEHFVVTDEIGEQAAISVTARIRQTKAQERLSKGTLLSKVGDRLKLPPLRASSTVDVIYNDQLSRQVKPFGYSAGSRRIDWERDPAVVMLLHCYLQNPCSGPHDMVPGQDPSSSSQIVSESHRYEADVTEVSYSPSVVDEFNTYSEATAQAMYTVAELSSCYHFEDMTIQLPVANSEATSESESDDSQPATSVIVPLANPQCYRIFEANLERVGAEPQIPDPVVEYELRGVKAIRKSLKIKTMPPIRSSDGRQAIYRSVVRYVYLLDRPPSLEEPLAVGTNPVTHFPGNTGQSLPDRTGDMGVDTTTSFQNS